ncbi:MAG: hypothetical protein AB1478_02810 [Nitrospirota bacterium]
MKTGGENPACTKELDARLWFDKRSTELTPKSHHAHPEPVEGSGMTETDNDVSLLMASLVT